MMNFITAFTAIPQGFGQAGRGRGEGGRGEGGRGDGGGNATPGALDLGAMLLADPLTQDIASDPAGIGSVGSGAVGSGAVGSGWTVALFETFAQTAQAVGWTPVIGTNGADLLSGGSGAQVLLGKGGDDRLEAGSGQDLLIGGRGGDAYIIDVTDRGNDIIYDMGNAPRVNGYYSTGLDVVQLDGYGDISEAMHSIDISYSGDDLVLHYASPAGAGQPGSSGQVTVMNHFAGPQFALDGVRFGDSAYDPLFHVSYLSGDNYTYSVHSGPDQGGEDIVLGSHLGDEIYGGIGDDILYGGAGVDHFKFHDEEEHGGGNDIILDFEVGRDQLDFTDILTLTMDGVEVSTSSYGNALVTTAYGSIELVGVLEEQVTEDMFAFF